MAEPAAGTDGGINGTNNNFEIDTTDSTNLVSCPDGSGDVSTYVAMDPKYAIASGCTQ